MVTQKKKFTDPGKEALDNGLLPPQSFPFTPDVVGTGFVGPDEPSNTRKGDDTPPPVKVPGTFQDVETGRPSGVTRGGRTFFIQGSDLELFQQQQDAKDALSGSLPSAESPRNTIAQNQEIRRKQALAAGITPGLTPSLTAPNVLFSGESTVAFGRFLPGGLSQEEIIRLNLTPLDVEVLQAGEAEISNLGRLAESMPIIGRSGIPFPGGRIRLSDFFGTPSKKVDELIALIKANTERAELKLQLAKGNPALARHYKDQIEELNQANLRLESRIKLLSIQSPAIQGNPDEIIRLQGEISDSNDTYADILRQLALF